MDLFFQAASKEHQSRERAKARELRASQWWRNRLGKGECYHCGQKFAKAQLNMDHLIPISRGGKTTKKNVVVSCQDCNTKKRYWTSAELRLRELEPAQEPQPHQPLHEND